MRVDHVLNHGNEIFGKQMLGTTATQNVDKLGSIVVTTVAHSGIKKTFKAIPDNFNLNTNFFQKSMN